MKLSGHRCSLFSFTHNNNNQRRKIRGRQRSEVTVYSVTLTGSERVIEDEVRNMTMKISAQVHFNPHTCVNLLSTRFQLSIFPLCLFM